MDKTNKTAKMSKVVRESLRFWADALETISKCSEEQWQKVTGHGRDESIQQIVQAMRNLGEK